MQIRAFEKAEEDYKKAQELEPKSIWAFCFYAELNLMIKNYDKADILLSQAEEINPEDPLIPPQRALYFAAVGEKEKALALNRNAKVFAILRMTDEAIDYIKRAIEGFQQSASYSYLSLVDNPFFDSLRNDTRFKEIVKEQNSIYEEKLKKYSIELSNL
jgi:tetratricopeptide (TPR) repeat protein